MTTFMQVRYTAEQGKLNFMVRSGSGEQWERQVREVRVQLVQTISVSSAIRLLLFVVAFAAASIDDYISKESNRSMMTSQPHTNQRHKYGVPR